MQNKNEDTWSNPRFPLPCPRQRQLTSRIKPPEALLLFHRVVWCGTRDTEYRNSRNKGQNSKHGVYLSYGNKNTPNGVIIRSRWYGMESEWCCTRWERAGNSMRRWTISLISPRPECNHFWNRSPKPFNEVCLVNLLVTVLSLSDPKWTRKGSLTRRRSCQLVRQWWHSFLQSITPP